jgi:hypothetical protein
LAPRLEFFQVVASQTPIHGSLPRPIANNFHDQRPAGELRGEGRLKEKAVREDQIRPARHRRNFDDRPGHANHAYLRAANAVDNEWIGCRGLGRAVS